MSPGPSPTPTPEQSAIIAGASRPESQMVRAYAGCAKTTTLQLAGAKVRTAALALAFNRSITKELAGKLPPSFETKSLNALGFGALRRGLPGVSLTVEKTKLVKLLNAVIKDWNLKLDQDQWGSARRLVTAAMQAGVTPEDQGSPMAPNTPETWQGLAADLWIPKEDFPVLFDLAREVLAQNVALTRSGVVSFDDQTYHPIVLEGKFLRFPTVFVDEAQDLSKLNHEMLRQSLRPDGKLLAVGDPKQAIYSFRGADGSSMDKVRELLPQDRWIDQRLTLTFRCPRDVVARQQLHAPGYRAAESCRQGRVEEWPRALDDAPDDVEWLDGWTAADLLKLAGDDPLAVLCRNNAPLLSLAFRLIRQRVSCWMIGRDIGKGLVALSKKIPLDDLTPLDQCLGRVREWRAREVELAKLNDNESAADSASDRAECLLAVFESGAATDGASLRTALAGLFAKETGRVCLSTIHKAKGLEWHTVLHLDPWRVPSPSAKRAADRGDPVPLEQELNLRYVAETRTQCNLVLASLEDFQ